MAVIKQREDCLYIYKVESVRYNNSSHKMEYKLSDEHIFFDKGRAIYYRGFDSPYILIGMFRTICNEPVRSEIMQTEHLMGNEFIFGRQSLMVMWTGKWRPLERMGFCGAMLQQQTLVSMINEIMRSVQENDGKLKDRC